MNNLDTIRHHIHSGDLYRARLLAEGDALATEYVAAHTTTPINRPAPEPVYGNGDDYGDGDGFGDGDGNGDGNGFGFGDGNGYGNGHSYSYSNGFGDGDGNGDGAGHGSGKNYNYPHTHNMDLQPSTPENTEALPIVLVVQMSGWITIGHARLDLETLYLFRPQRLRSWSTGAGYGPVVTKGPAASCALDPAPSTIIPRNTILHVCPCPPEAWTDYLRSNALK